MFIETFERLKKSFFKQYLIIIALKDLHVKNDLITSIDFDILINEEDFIVNNN